MNKINNIIEKGKIIAEKHKKIENIHKKPKKSFIDFINKSMLRW